MLYLISVLLYMMLLLCYLAEIFVRLSVCLPFLFSIATLLWTVYPRLFTKTYGIGLVNSFLTLSGPHFFRNHKDRGEERWIPLPPSILLKGGRILFFLTSSFEGDRPEKGIQI